MIIIFTLKQKNLNVHNTGQYTSVLNMHTFSNDTDRI